ncbi:hypothetical protein M408DRAFT_103504 [Serendipita vermifera MAFF 305830]|uniref:Uncharacterized protein n=1 Tax=Serendipita vermifera MAFF 305830 TaxID=933852 RepID=A0A0C3AA37_SERVB|nr:hypothetical protein M408DRAFT_103504 [Serendipita vermifera MAFF 305830]
MVSTSYSRQLSGNSTASPGCFTLSVMVLNFIEDPSKSSSRMHDSAYMSCIKGDTGTPLTRWTVHVQYSCNDR